eukprot:49032-Chlamydomonas_euryale.AAC.2
MRRLGLEAQQRRVMQHLVVGHAVLRLLQQQQPPHAGVCIGVARVREHRGERVEQARGRARREQVVQLCVHLGAALNEQQLHRRRRLELGQAARAHALPQAERALGWLLRMPRAAAHRLGLNLRQADAAGTAAGARRQCRPGRRRRRRQLRRRQQVGGVGRNLARHERDKLGDRHPVVHAHVRPSGAAEPHKRGDANRGQAVVAAAHERLEQRDEARQQAARRVVKLHVCESCGLVVIEQQASRGGRDAPVATQGGGRGDTGRLQWQHREAAGATQGGCGGNTGRLWG